MVDGLLDDVDRAGQEVGGEDDGDVLVQHARREGEGVLVPEGAAEDLVAGDAVAEQDPVPGDMGARAGLLHRFAEHRGLFEIPVGPQPQDVAGGEVGPGAVEFGQHPGVRAGRDDVVAVDERQELRTGVGLADPGVAGRAEPGVLLPDQPEAGVAFRELLGQSRAVVRGAVVDEDDLQVRHGLLGERGQAGTEVLLDVVEGDDDGETGCHRGARSFRGLGLRGRGGPAGGHGVQPAPWSPVTRGGPFE
ncbi:hypothetical protein P376_4281 [Streptomyces sp. HCCB10043]|nr:hypothetical protein P376_4281 [Streptomyces sp. HCCB10043]